jgi:hypothetical protein
MKRLLPILLLVLVGIACASKKKAIAPTAASAQPKVDSVLTAIEREPCFGKCPEYYAAIYKSGYVRYLGKKNVDKIGTFQGQLQPDQVTEIYNAISLYRMEQKDTLYNNKYLVDFPAWSIWIGSSNPVKKIYVNDQSPPDDLAGFADYVERVLLTVKWKEGP